MRKRNTDPHPAASALRLALLGSLVAGLCGCADRNITATTAFSDRYPQGNQTGVFRPGNVAGLDFVAGPDAGVTDASGSFHCVIGQTIGFSIGSVDLGSANCATFVHPAALTSSGSLMDAAAINIMRLLMTLDEDSMPENGILIPEPLRTLAKSWPDIDFSATDFESQLAQVLSDVASVNGANAAAVPSAAEAFTFLDASLSCAYSGVFINTFSAGTFSAPTDVTVIVRRELGASTNGFIVRIRRSHPQSQMYLEAHGTVELGALPLLIDSGENWTGSVDADYKSPDIVGGAFADAIAQQPIDRNGFFEAVRIGPSVGEYRFVGTYSRPNEFALTTPVPAGLVTLTLRGDTLRGEGFDFAIRSPFDVTGTLQPGSDAVTLTTTLTQETSTVTLAVDQTGAPQGFEGAWPGIAGGSVEAVGCRLN